MKIFEYAKLNKEQKTRLCERAYSGAPEVKNAVAAVSARVLKEGDGALLSLTEKFDGVKLKTLKVSPAEFAAASKKVPAALKAAMKTAKRNIEIFHKAQMPARAAAVETSRGVKCWRGFTPVGTAGLYVPGGSAPLFSTVLMLAVPAKVADCKNIILCTPPRRDGTVAPEILYAASLCGVKDIYKAGGAQAIFAMAYGTGSVPRADKIFGPGNKYVTEAKIQAGNFVATDMPAGPSEVLVIADKSTNAAFAAADILSQAEHGPDSQSVLVSADASKTAEILEEVQKQLAVLPRKDIAAAALTHSFAVNVSSLRQAFEFSNLYAPEHLILNFKTWRKYVNLVENAGSVFCGPFTSEPFGDYTSGTNHTLPTAGFARGFSGVNAQSFGKWITYQTADAAGLKTLGKKTIIMAEAEGLAAHAAAVAVRMGLK